MIGIATLIAVALFGSVYATSDRESMQDDVAAPLRYVPVVRLGDRADTSDLTIDVIAINVSGRPFRYLPLSKLSTQPRSCGIYVGDKDGKKISPTTHVDVVHPGWKSMASLGAGEQIQFELDLAKEAKLPNSGRYYLWVHHIVSDDGGDYEHGASAIQLHQIIGAVEIGRGVRAVSDTPSNSQCQTP